jgi:hypothetical protein
VPKADPDDHETKPLSLLYSFQDSQQPDIHQMHEMRHRF